MKKLKSSWTSGMSEEDALKLKEEFAKSAPIRVRLIEMLEKKFADEAKSRVSKLGYDSPNWALLQADSVGFQRALKEVISLL